MVQNIAAQLMNAVRANPTDPSAWRARLERTFPEPAGVTKWEIGLITDVGPGAQADWRKTEVESARADAVVAGKDPDNITMIGNTAAPPPAIRSVSLPPQSEIIDVEIVKVKPPEDHDELQDPRNE